MNVQTELITHLILLGLFTFVAVGFLWVARKFKLLKIPQEPSCSEVSGPLVLIAFGLYFGFFKVLAPIILLLSIRLSAFSMDQATLVLANLAFIWVATLLTALLTMAFGIRCKKAIWSPRSGDFSTIYKAALLSPIYYLLAFPWVLVVGELYMIGGLVIYGEALPVLEQSMVTFLRQILPYPVLFAMTAFTVVFVVPVQEEILFRGLLQRWISKKYSYSLAILLSSLLFSLLHYSPDQGMTNFMILPTLFCFSIFLGIAYEKWGTLWASIALHTFFNGLSILLMVTNWGPAG